MVVSKNGKMYYYISTYLRLRTTFFLKKINNAAVEIPTPIPTKRRAFFLKEEHKPLEREKIRRREKKKRRKKILPGSRHLALDGEHTLYICLVLERGISVACDSALVSWKVCARRS